MPSKNVKNVLKVFRTRFRGEEADLPLSLRQESNEIIYTALLEDDESPMPPPTPMFGYSPEAGNVQGAAGPDVVGELMRASMDAQPAPQPQAPPEPPGGAPAPQQAPQGAPPGGNPLEDLMGLL